MNSLLQGVESLLDLAIRLVRSIPAQSNSASPSVLASLSMPVSTSAMASASGAGGTELQTRSGTFMEEYRRSMMRLRQTEQCESEILAFARDVFQTEHVGLLLWDEDRGMFVNHRSLPGARSEWNIYDPFFLTISEMDRVLSYEDVPSVADPEDRKNLVEFCADTGARWIVPMVLNEAVLAVLFAGEPPPVHGVDRALLEDLRSYGALSLSNSIIYTRVEALLLSLEDKVKERTRQLEDATNQMIQSEKMATLGVMVAGVAHELNTPSGVILNASANLVANMESLMDRIIVSDWLSSPEQASRFARITRFFHFHLLATNPGIPRNAYQLRQQVGDALHRVGVDGAGELAAFLAEYGFFDDPRSLDADRLRERLEGDHLLSMIVGLYTELEASVRPFCLGYLRDIAGIHRNARNIAVSGKSISRLVKALRIYSRSGKGDVVPANLVELIESTLEVLGSVWKHQVEVERRLAPLPVIPCDPDALNQVWSNLLMNAYQAAREKESPRLGIETRLEESGQYVRVSVSDNGPGIPEALSDRIWDPFFTTKEQGQGTGLGLAIVRRIVEEHQGEISYVTGHDGTVFTVRLPIERKKGRQMAPPQSSLSAGRYDWR